MPQSTYELGTIGAGNMCEGIVRGVLGAGLFERTKIITADPAAERKALFSETFGVAVTEDNRQVARDSRIILLAVKPQIFPEAAVELRDLIRDEQLLISIMAGVSTKGIEEAFSAGNASGGAASSKRGPRVVRVMPNLPMILGAGVAGVCGGQHATAEDLALTQRIFDAAGRSVLIEDEAQMDAVTAVSGSGPAYYYLFTEAIIEGGVRAGLERETAELLAKQTCLGAARMMLETGEHPEALREKVTSKKGTTHAALESMRGDLVFEHIASAVVAAFERGRELGG